MAFRRPQNQKQAWRRFTYTVLLSIDIGHTETRTRNQGKNHRVKKRETW